MVKPILLVLGAVPAVVAALLVLPMLTQPEIPFSAAVPEDNIEIEYTVHDLRRVSFGVTDRTAADRTDILTIERDGDVTLLQIYDGYPQPAIHYDLREEEVIRIVALIKETGFMALPEDTFAVMDNVTEYTRYTIKITLNGAVTKITWPEVGATDRFIPPIITRVETTMNDILERVRDR